MTLVSHISTALQSLSTDDADVAMQDMLKEHGAVGILEQHQDPVRCRPFASDEAGLKEN